MADRGKRKSGLPMRRRLSQTNRTSLSINSKNFNADKLKQTKSINKNRAVPQPTKTTKQVKQTKSTKPVKSTKQNKTSSGSLSKNKKRYPSDERYSQDYFSKVDKKTNNKKVNSKKSKSDAPSIDIPMASIFSSIPSTTSSLSSSYSSSVSSSVSSSSTPSRKSRFGKPKRNSGVTAKRFAAGVLICILFYLAAISYEFLTRGTIPYDTIEYGTIDTPKAATGIIVRNENVYTAPATGTIRFYVADNEKVRNGELICSIQDEAVVSSMEESLEEINKNILAIQETRDDLSSFSEDKTRVNNQIKNIVDENVFDIVGGDINKIYYLKDNIKNKIDTRNQMLLSENSGSLQEWATKKTEQENKISQNTATIKSQDGGIISYGFDGLEATITMDNIENFTQEQTLMKKDDNTVNQATGQVNQNDTVFKIVKSNDWYIASYINSDYITEWAEGDMVNLYLSEDGETVSKEALVYKLNQSDKKSYVVLKLTKDMIRYIDQRSINFEMSKSLKGFKINNNAIVEVHTLKIPSQYVNDDGIIKKVSGKNIVDVKVSTTSGSENGDYVYVPVEYGVLNAKDEIVNPNDSEDIYTVQEMQSEKGIYVINTGVTEFKKIDLENSVSNSTHTILDTSLNNNIKLYDRIITDVKNVQEQQKVYR